MTTQLPNQNEENLITPEMWGELNFEGKAYCSLNAAQELVLTATEHAPERVLSAVTVDNCLTVAAALAEKFKEVEQKCQELDAEWNQTEDKLKLSGKVARLKDYVQRANAIGDYTPIHKNLIEKEKQVQSLYDVNYAEKLKLAEQAEALQESEDWKATTDAYRAVVDEWKNANPADKGRSDKLWERIEKARNHFYERKRQHQESIEQEMMQNLDLKMEVCETAELHAASEDWRKSSDIMKELMDKWKTIGRVASHEKNEELWNRFINARNAFFDRKKVHFEQIQTEQEANLSLKIALVERAETLSESTDWKETTQALSEIMDEWKGIGKVPYEKADELWSKLQVARDKFFAAKRQSAETFKVNLEDNYAQKQALMNRAEALKNSTNWREATEEMNELMAEWKKIGHIPREYGDELWEHFISARHHFFNRKDADREKRKERFQSQLDNRLVQTEQFLAKIKEELEDEEAKLAEFTESLKNAAGDGPKDVELRNHLNNLIQQIERKLPARREKVEEVSKQWEELQQKRGENTAEK